MNLLYQGLLLSGLCIIRFLASGQPLDDPCSSPCPPCPMIAGCTQLQKDECGCCDLCVKENGQLCGPGVGVCGADMKCNQDALHIFTCRPSAVPITGPVIVITPQKVSSAAKKQANADKIAARKLKNVSRKAARQQQRAEKKKLKKAERKAKKEAKKERKRLAEAGNGKTTGNPITDVDDIDAPGTNDKDDVSMPAANGMVSDGTDPRDTADDTDVGATGDDTGIGATEDDTDIGATEDDTDIGATEDDTDIGGTMDKTKTKEERKAHKEARNEKKPGKGSGNTDHMPKSDSNGSHNETNDADGDKMNGHEISTVMEPVTAMHIIGNAKSQRKEAKKLARKNAKREKKLARILAKLKAKANKFSPAQNEIINVDETTTLSATTMLSQSVTM